jgi:anthranilate phosphoribosyltransferase
VLQKLGTKAAFVVHGAGRLDELTTTGPNRVSYFGVAPANGRVLTETLDPSEFGFTAAQPQEIGGAGPGENAKITSEILAGQQNGPCRDIVVLNAAAALVAGGKAPDLREGIALATQSLESGAALRALEALRNYSQRAAA